MEDCQNSQNVIFQAKIIIEVLFLLHLISALPIILNPPFQFFEEVLKIPSSKLKYHHPEMAIDRFQTFQTQMSKGLSSGLVAC